MTHPIPPRRCRLPGHGRRGARPRPAWSFIMSTEQLSDCCSAAAHPTASPRGHRAATQRSLQHRVAGQPLPHSEAGPSLQHRHCRAAPFGICRTAGTGGSGRRTTGPGSPSLQLPCPGPRFLALPRHAILRVSLFLALSNCRAAGPQGRQSAVTAAVARARRVAGLGRCTWHRGGGWGVMGGRLMRVGRSNDRPAAPGGPGSGGGGWGGEGAGEHGGWAGARGGPSLSFGLVKERREEERWGGTQGWLKRRKRAGEARLEPGVKRD